MPQKLSVSGEEFDRNIVAIQKCLGGNKYTTLAGDEYTATVGDVVKAFADGNNVTNIDQQKQSTVNEEFTVVKLYDINRYQPLPQLNNRYSYHDGNTSSNRIMHSLIN